MELVNEYIYMLADYSQQKGLNLEITLNTNIKGHRRWIISLREPTGLLNNWWFREHNESLLSALKEMWEKLPYKESLLSSEPNPEGCDTTGDAILTDDDKIKNNNQND